MDIKAGVLIAHREPEVEVDPAKEIDHTLEAGKVRHHHMVDRDVEVGLNRLDELVRPGVEGGVDLVGSSGTGDRNPGVPGDREHFDLPARAEAGDDDHVASLTRLSRAAAECPCLPRCAHEAPRIRTDEEQVHRLTGLER